MRSQYILVFTVFAVIFVGPFMFSDAVADENSCTFKAAAGKVHLRVWDEDSGEDRQGKIFEGWLESGENKKVQSTTGFIVYSYQEEGADRSYGDNHKTCKGGDTIRVP